MTQIKANSFNTTHGNIEFEQTTNTVISDFIQQRCNMYRLRIYNRYSEDNWYSEYECLTADECYNYLERNYARELEDPGTPYVFEIIDPYGHKVLY